jgi:DNA-binding response OmpR family regulator
VNTVTKYHIDPQVRTGARLLIVDDEPNIRTPLARALSLQGYAVEEADSGSEALKLLKDSLYNLMVLDLRMPGLDGVEVMQRAHQICPELLIIILTGHATLESAIAAVKAEAVDYLLKPASTQEILTAVDKALDKNPKQFTEQQLTQVMSDTLDVLRQAAAPPPPPPQPQITPTRFVRTYPLILDRQTRLVALNDDSPYVIELTAGEMELLASLMHQPGQVFSCRELAEAAWGYDMEESEAQGLVRPHISRLRRKLETNPQIPRLIRTVRRRGYYFAALEK